MKDMAILELTGHVHQALLSHLLPKRQRAEEVAFVFAVADGAAILRQVDWMAVPESGFVSRSLFHLELTDETRGTVIKRAHDLGSSLVEFHSHAGTWPAQFSASDLAGFDEFVPHVRWRLKGRPYVSVVVSRTGFDGFIWTTDSIVPDRLAGISVDGRVLQPTALSPLYWDHDDGKD